MEYIASSVLGIITGVVSSYLVTRYYRNLDFVRQKNRYLMDMKRHLTIIIRALSEINIYKEASYVEQLRTELLEVPLKEKEFKFKEYEIEMIDQYYTNRKNIFEDLANFQENKYALETAQEESNEKEKQQIIINTIASRLPAWIECKKTFLEKEIEDSCKN